MTRYLPLVLVFFVVTAAGACAEDLERAHGPDRYGFSVMYGNTYTPRNDIGLALASAFGLFDYGKVWHHPAPEALRFKLECAVGSATGSESGMVASAGILALYYLDRFAKGAFRPYVEAGIGGIYTEFRVKGQGLYFNFNPQAGIGTEIRSGSTTYLAAIRLHHISNGGLDHENRGINSVMFVIGIFL